MPLFSPGAILGAQTVSAYQISRSLRFRSSASAYLSRTFTSGNRQTWTWSAWVKRGAISQRVGLFGQRASDTPGFNIEIQADNTLAAFSSGDSGAFTIITTPVFRDPSAWYHIVFSVNTTLSSGRCVVYVNGVSQALATNTTSLNYNTGLNTTNQHEIGRLGATVLSPFDGYLAEVNFIDGQALTPSSFGEYDTLTGNWNPKAYTGSYGTNGFYLPFSLNTTSTYAGSFNGSSQYLTVPDSSLFTMGSGNFTAEAWVNFSASGRQIIFYQGDNAGSNVSISFFIERSSTNKFRFLCCSGGTEYDAVGTSTLPTNQWVHLAGVRDGNNIKCFVNGVLETTASISTASINDSTYNPQISGYGGTNLLVNGSISNLRIVKGTAVYTANFTPPSSALTAISGTSLLCLQSSSATQDNSGNSLTITNVGSVTTASATPFVANVTADASGNNNGWIPANINASSSGTTYDSMIDSPTNYADGGNGRGNYATLNPLDAGLAPTDGNLTLPSAGSLWRTTRATISIPESAKVYWEITVNGTTSNNMEFGVDVNSSLTTYLGAGANGWTFEPPNTSGSTSARKGNNNTFSSVTLPSAATSNDTYMFAVDRSANSIWVGINGSWVGSVGVSGALFTTLPSTGVLFPASCNYNQISYINFGQRPFAYTPPTGYSALNTQNLPAPALTPSP